MVPPSSLVLQALRPSSLPAESLLTRLNPGVGGRVYRFSGQREHLNTNLTYLLRGLTGCSALERDKGLARFVEKDARIGFCKAFTLSAA